MSNVPDTTTKVKLSGDKKAVDMEGVQWIINPWDELALSRAIELKEKYPSEVENITVINVGSADAEPTLRKALAMGADNGIRINASPIDAYCVAACLADVIKAKSFDIVLCGIESSDYNGCVVGGMLAEFLDMASVSSVSFLDIENGQPVVNREIDGGFEKLNLSLPFVGIVQKGIAIEPKIPTMRGIMTARTKPFEVIEASGTTALTAHIAYELPQAKAACKMVDAENVKQLVELLRDEAKAL